MLQQTQVARVVPKYKEFLRLFPSVEVLATASLADVLRAWSGLGYNRRAKYLHEAAKQLQDKRVWTLEDLIACKGIGPNTAPAILVYAYNQAIPFVETNTRTVYIHHFFAERTDVDDKELLNLVAQTLDRKNPREFMWAIMDEGTYLKATDGNANWRSKHYARQSPFDGSRRQIRGTVLKVLAQRSERPIHLRQLIPDERLPLVLEELHAEGLISKTHGRYLLTT